MIAIKHEIDPVHLTIKLAKSPAFRERKRWRQGLEREAIGDFEALANQIALK
jgi:hypothetical protein